MPDWSPDWNDVDFDHAAAADAADECRRVAAKLAAARTFTLPPAVTTARTDWTGALADEFDLAVPAIMTDLDDVDQALVRLASDIDAASAAATAEQTRRESDRARWHAERAAEQAANDCRLPSGRPMPC